MEVPPLATKHFCTKKNVFSDVFGNISISCLKVCSVEAFLSGTVAEQEKNNFIVIPRPQKRDVGGKLCHLCEAVEEFPSKKH